MDKSLALTLCCGAGVIYSTVPICLTTTFMQQYDLAPTEMESKHLRTCERAMGIGILGMTVTGLLAISKGSEEALDASLGGCAIAFAGWTTNTICHNCCCKDEKEDQVKTQYIIDSIVTGTLLLICLSSLALKKS
mmetsp:Transcript_3496/g.4032  ORF Transcript_3496/g.4032 Transcript_3496/m.4032 type:complete len:135 (+) Transcript_3496:257-661(+)